MRDWTGALRTFGGATENARRNWSYSTTPYLDMLVRILGFITVFVMIWVVMGLVFSSEPGIYVQYIVGMVLLNGGLFGFRAWMRRR